jgi:hypothetical protein
MLTAPGRHGSFRASIRSIIFADGIEVAGCPSRRRVVSSPSPAFDTGTAVSLQSVDKYVTINLMRDTRLISWIKTARKEFEEFPEDVQSDVFDALTIAAEGGKSDKAKPGLNRRAP